MGVSRLLKYIEENDDARQNVQLAELAKRKLKQTGKFPKLVCDYITLKIELLSLQDSALIHRKELPRYSLLCGGNYQLYAKRVQMFVKTFQQLGIDLVFFVDGPIGANEAELQAKLSERKKRYLLSLQTIATETEICDQKKDSTSLVWHTPELASAQVLMTLRDAGVQIIICQGEADIEIAQYARSHVEVLGILANDTDFSIMKNCTLFPMALNRNILGIKSHDSIVCEMVSPTTLARSLDLEEQQLPDLSILCGNGYTKTLNRQLDVWTELELDSTDIKSIAQWLHGKNIPLTKYQPMHDFLLKHPQYLEAVQCSYRFYSSTGVQLIEPASLFCSFVKKEIQAGCMVYGLLSVVENAVYWRSIVGESLTLGHPSMHDLLLPVRKVIYMLLGLKSVREFGRTSTHSFAETSINVHVEDMQIIHSLQGIDNNAKMSGVFHLMVNACELSHPGAVKSIIEQIKETPLQMPISIRDAIMCAALLFTTKVNDTFQPPHCFIKTELSSLLVSCLTCCAQIPPHQTSLLPSMRAITLGNRFLHTLKHVYYLASVVGLGRKLPQPKDLFYPMAFIPYHVLITHQKNSDDSCKLMRIRKAKEIALSLEAVHTFLLAILSPGQLPNFSELVHLFSSAVKAVEDNRESLDPDESFPLSTRSEDSSQADTDDEETLQVPPQAPDASISVTVPNQTSIAHLSSHSASKPENLDLNKQKCSLPVFKHRESILRLIAAHQIVCIVGETGCGKSSQIPQYIIDDSSKPRVCRILVSQPNHMAAKNLAKRVAYERNEEVGGTVGYCSEGASNVSKKTRLTYCTTEYMLENLVYKHQDVSYSHIILDEVHERSVDIDIIMFIIRKLALKLPDLKVVLMSATLQEDLFVNYFQQVFGPEQVCEPYFVGVKRFPVDVYFIDEIVALRSRMEQYWCEKQLTATKHLETLVDELSQEPEVLKFHPVITAFAKKICTNLIISQSKLGEGILVFLPSFSDLSDYCNELTNILRRKQLHDRILVFVFHGLVPNEEQDAIFKLPPNDRVHVILSNKAAESSITVPNLRMVINFGINQNLEYNSQRKMSCLKKRWCSRSSCFQREGRVGRVFKGIAVHLFTREFFDTSLPEFDAAEITKYPLAKTVLKAKQLGHELNIPLPSQFLSLVIEPPSLLNFEAALQDLVIFGAVVYNPDKGVCEDTDITLVGKFCLSLPLDLKLGRLVLFGIFFGCPFDAIVMAAALSMYQDVFTLPTRMVIKDLFTYRNSLKRSMDARLNFDNGYYSHPIMMCNMFVEWLHFRSSKWNVSRGVLARQFAYKYSVRADRLLHFESLVGEIALHVCQFVPSTAQFYKQMQHLSHVVERGAGMPHFEQPGTSFTSAVNLSFKIPFCDDSVFLKALIAAASPNLIIRGKPEHESSDPYLRKRARVAMNMVKDVQFDPFSTIAMEIEDAEADEDEIEEDKISEDEIDVDKIDVDKIDEDKIDEDKIDEDEIDADEIDEDKIDEAILQKLVNKMFPSQTDFRVKIVDDIALVQFSQSSSMRLFWQFPEIRENWKIEGINANFPMPFHPYCLTWSRLIVNRDHANVHYFNWRNPAGFVCRIQPTNHSIFAVASKMIGTNDPNYVLASHITILPQMPQGLLLLLAFQPFSTNIQLLLEEENSRISAVRINSQEIKHTAEFINTADIWRINKLRKALSEAMICFLNVPIDHPVIVNIPTLLQDVLNRTDSDLSNPPTYVTTSGKASQPHHPATVWETISPGVDFSAVSQTAVDNKYSHFYPSFQCSLTGGQPYSVREEVLSQARGKRKSSLHDFVENNDGESSQCIFQSYCKCFKEHQKQTSKPKIKFKKFFKTYLHVTKTSCAGASMQTIMLRKPTMRLEEDIVTTQLIPKPRIFFKTHPNYLNSLSIGRRLYLVKQKLNTVTSVPSWSSKPGSDQHMVQYFVDCLKKRGGEASITSLRKTFATFVEMLPDDISCPYSYLGKSFFESHPENFTLVQGCGFCTVKLSLTSTDNESLTSDNAVNSIQAVSHPEPVVKQRDVTKKPAVVEATSVLMPSSSTSDPDYRIDDKLQPTSSSITCQPGSEGNSRNSTSTVSSTIQPCSYVPEASQDSKLQSSGPLLTKALTSIPYECFKPGSDQHMIQYFVDCLKKRGGEASITSLRKAFSTYVEMLPNILCSYSCKFFFKSHPKYFKLVQGHGLCTVKLSLTSADNESLTFDSAVNSIKTVSDPEPVAKQSHVTKLPAVTSVLMPSSSTSDPYHKIDVKLQPTSSSIVSQPGSEGDSRNSVSSTIQPCSYVPEASQDSKLQSSSPLLTKALTCIPYERSKPGSDQHMVEFFVDYLKAQSGKASITSLQQNAFPVYLERFSNDVKKHCMNKQFFKSHPQYFELIEGDGTCTVKLSMLPPDEFRSETCNRVDITKTAQSQCASTTTDPEPKVKQKSRGYLASATTIKCSHNDSAKEELSVCEQKGMLPIVEVPPGEKTTLDAVKPTLQM